MPSFIREIEPGEIIAIDENGVRSTRFAEATPKGCVFEYVYLARPDAAIAGRSVYESRVEMGRQLARENNADDRYRDPGSGSRYPGSHRLRRGIGRFRSPMAS